LRKKFLVEEELSEQKLKEILDPILLGTLERSTHKVKFRTSKGILHFVAIPLKNPKRYSDIRINEVLRKIILWERKNTNNLQDRLAASGIKIREIVKESPQTLELKKK
jgi:hypothetical protein